MRRVTIEAGVAEYAEGSVLIAFGDTRIWCAASVEERVPAWLEGRGRGWVTAEYAMLPRSTHTRTNRDRAVNSGRSQEISRLIGRSLRASIDLKALGERTITVDCDVLQADGGTRTAAITGGYVALALAVDWLRGKGSLSSNPLTGAVAAVSAGIVAGLPLLDLDYREDSAAEVDCNVVMTGAGELIEVQSTAERRGIDRPTFDSLLDLAAAGISQLLAIQQVTLDATKG